MKRPALLLAASLLASAAAGALPAAASAAPAPFEGFPATCPDIGTVILTSPGNGLFTPAFIKGTNQLLVPYAVDVTITSAGGSTRVSGAKDAPLPADHVTCTMDVTFHFNGEAYTMVGSITGVVVGQP